MTKTVLLTSFTTWLPHQSSNASDDLLAEITEIDVDANLHFLRQLPVDFDLAPRLTLEAVDRLRPDVILCCGMAESRSQLNLESRAVVGNETLYTPVQVQQLAKDLEITQVSDCAGRFVCNALYYAILKQLAATRATGVGLFVHVPLLTSQNRRTIVSDFQRILKQVTALN